MKLVRGTKDWINSDVDIYNHLISILKKNAHLHGFSEIFVPILEDLSLFSRAVGEDTDIVSKEMYFAVNKNQLDKNSLDKTKDESDKTVLRPEATSSVVRFLGSNGLLQSMPQKLYTYGPMFRYERPQKGRLRQLHQFSLECFGLAEPTADADVIKYAQKVLHEIGLHDVELEINSIGDDESRFAYKKALVDYLSKYKNDLSEDSQRRLITNPLRILDTKNEKDQEILLTAPKLSDYLNDHSKRFFDSVLLLLSKIGVEYAINEKLVRGLDYYNHTVFEFKLDSFGAQSTLIGGGRYDGLVAKMFGPDKNIPAIGWGMGLDRVVMILKEAGLGNIENRNKKIAILMWNDDITSDEGDINTLDSYRAFGMTLAEKVRKFYIGAEVIFGKKIGDCLKKAINMNFDYVFIVGMDEFAKSTVVFKNLTDRTQVDVDLCDLDNFLLKHSE